MNKNSSQNSGRYRPERPSLSNPIEPVWKPVMPADVAGDIPLGKIPNTPIWINLLVQEVSS